MGCVPSKEDASPKSQVHHASQLSATEPRRDGNARAAAPPAAPAAAAAADAPVNIVEGPTASEVQHTLALQASAVMRKTMEVLKELGNIPTDGSRTALGQAAAILLQQLPEAECTSICATRSESRVCIVGAAAGLGSSIIEQQLVITDRQYSVLQFVDQLANYLYRTVTVNEDVEALPPDWRLLHAKEGLASFLAVPVQVGQALVGVVTVASRNPSAFQEYWWHEVLDCVCPSLSRQLNHPLMTGLCALADAIETHPADDYKTFIAMLLQRCAAMIESVTHLRLRVRLGLLSRDGSTVMVYHITNTGKPGQTEEGDAVLHSVRLRATETVLQEAVAAKAPRIVQDTGKYIHAVTNPSSDVLLEGEECVHSVVVLPFKLVGGAPFQAGIYVADSKPSDFVKSKLTITNMAAMLGCLLAKHLQERGLLTHLWDELPPSLEKISKSGSEQYGGGAACEGAAENIPPGGAPAPAPAPAPAAAAAAAAAAGSSLGLGAGGLVQRLQQQVRQALESSQAHQRAQRQHHKYVEDLQLLKLLGKGGFGIVYSGIWLGSPAAIKVMSVPQKLRGVMKGAMEMAVMQSLSHPNIVRVYACLTDLVEEAVSSGSVNAALGPIGPTHNPVGLRFREAAPDEDSPTCNLMVMELCDKGSLQTALGKGLLHERQGQAVTVNMQKLLTVLLDIARSVEHIHSASTIHCDLKLANVLLKSSADSPLGFVCKLTDFGLAKVLTNERFYMINKSSSGTVTHLPPERFETGSKLTPAVDIYAFGMIMFQLLTSERPFKGLPAAGIIQA